MGYLHEKRMKDELNEVKNRLDERITRLEKALEEASKPRENEPAENTVKEEVNKGKVSVMILPVQSYVNMLVLENAEIRPVGRVAWLNGKDPKIKFAPSTNALFIIRP